MEKKGRWKHKEFGYKTQMNSTIEKKLNGKYIMKTGMYWEGMVEKHRNEVAMG